ncbi:MFS transporter [Promicromonospora iranensis]|uniref:MFS family arabinose efflux permease n=1 Tax=Promicromonospora iranensis TaxID=1105144 RepID=A0ABU2CRQ5_9MICO|nr:MFS transporter [Promicromonospora iranensis]MDR7384029.1 putative MFS family arabinose efflux permease [Promicromonospora iranensis]
MRHPHLVTLTATTFVTWTGQRITAVALPLVALDQTGDAWTTGLVGGFAGLPLLTSAWWGRSLRSRLASGRALAVLLAVQVLGLAMVPVAAATVGVGAVVLCATGLVTGTTSAMLAPAQRALTADLAELPGNGPDVGARALAWQDLAHRSSMIFAPPLGAWLLVVWGAVPLLWCEAAAVALGAVAMLTVPAASAVERTPSVEPDRRNEPAPSIRSVLRHHPDLAVGIGLAGIGGVTWFAFTLGLTLLGAELDRPGELVAAGMAGYGAATVGMSFVVPLVVHRVPRLPAIIVSWVMFGLAYLALPLVAPDLLAVALVSAVGGTTMPFGIAALNALIVDRTTGAERRTAFTAETVLHSGGASAGLLVGGAVIGAFGAGPVLVATGMVQVAAAVGAVLWLRARHAADARRPARDLLVRASAGAAGPSTGSAVTGSEVTGPTGKGRTS